MIFPMHVGDRVCPWSLFHCQGNFSVFCSFIRMLQLEETLLCKQCAECVVCLWLCCVAAVPNVHNLCVFIPPIVSRFWLFVAPICDLWRWMERSTMILQRHLVSFFVFLCETCQDAILNNSVFYIGNQRLVESLIPSLFFPCWADRILSFVLFWGHQMFEYRRPARWCPFLICSNYTVSGSVELMHSMVNTFFFRFCPMEVYLDAPWFLRGMRAPTDGSPLKAFMTLSSMNSTGSEFVSSVLMLEHWMMVRFRDGLLTELPMELSPTGALQRCVVFPIGNVNEPCYCFFSACKCVLRDCQSIWSKVVCWCNDSFFCFSGQWSGTIRDLEWNNASNHAAARVYLLSQCTIVRLRDLPLGDKIKPIIFQRFQIARMASLPCVFRFFIRMCQLETLRFASNVLCVVFCLRCFFVYQFA